MTWLKLDDGFPEHERIDPLTAHAFRLHVTALCFCARNLTDGHLREKDVRVLLVRSGAKARHVTELLESGVWEQNGDGGHRVRDYLQYNPSAEQFKRERELTAERQRRWKESRNASSNASPNASRDASANAAPSRPVPSITKEPSFLPSQATDGKEGRNLKLEHILGDIA